MKRICLVLLCLILAAVTASAQAMNNRQVLKRLGLTDDQISQFSVIQQQALPEIRSAQTDMRQAKEALARLLLDPRADPQEIDRRVHAVTDAEARLRIAQIRREMAVRQLIGDRAWRKLVLYLRLRKELLRAEVHDPKASGAPNEVAADQRTLLKDLQELMGEDTSSPTQ